MGVPNHAQLFYLLVAALAVLEVLPRATLLFHVSETEFPPGKEHATFDTSVNLRHLLDCLFVLVIDY